MKRLITISAALAIVFAVTSLTQAGFDQNVTQGVIFGSGNANGSFTVDTGSGVELGLRAKLRHDATGQPQNTFNSNGDGTYTFQAGVAPTQTTPTAEWSIEWAINTDYDNSTGNVLDDYTYIFGRDTDPTAGTSFITGDVINVAYGDHSIGDNSTTDSTDSIAANPAEYVSLIANNNVAQNSWKAHWVLTPFDPTVTGTYDFYLAAIDASGAQVARTDIAVNVVPEPATMALLALGGLFFRKRK